MTTKANRPIGARSEQAREFIAFFDPGLLSQQMTLWDKQIKGSTPAKAKQLRELISVGSLVVLAKTGETFKGGVFGPEKVKELPNVTLPAGKAKKDKAPKPWTPPEVQDYTRAYLMEQARRLLIDDRTLRDLAEGNTPIFKPMTFMTDSGPVIFIVTRSQQTDEGTEFWSCAVNNIPLSKNCHLRSRLVLEDPDTSRELCFYMPTAFGKINGFFIHAVDGTVLRFWHDLNDGKRNPPMEKVIYKVSVKGAKVELAMHHDIKSE